MQTVIGIKTKDYVILATTKCSSLYGLRNSSSYSRTDCVKNICIAYSKPDSDIIRLFDKAKVYVKAQTLDDREITPCEVINYIARTIEKTCPEAIMKSEFLVTGSAKNSSELYFLGPLGCPRDANYCALGDFREYIRSILSSSYSENLTPEQTKHLLFSIMATLYERSKINESWEVFEKKK